MYPFWLKVLVQDLVIMSESSSSDGGVVGDPARSDDGGEVPEPAQAPHVVTRRGPLRIYLVIASLAGWWQDYCSNTIADGPATLVVGQSLLIGAVLAQWDFRWNPWSLGDVIINN